MRNSDSAGRARPHLWSRSWCWSLDFFFFFDLLCFFALGSSRSRAGSCGLSFPHDCHYFLYSHTCICVTSCFCVHKTDQTGHSHCHQLQRLLFPGSSAWGAEGKGVQHLCKGCGSGSAPSPGQEAPSPSWPGRSPCVAALHWASCLHMGCTCWGNTCTRPTASSWGHLSFGARCGHCLSGDIGSCPAARPLSWFGSGGS